MTLGINDVIVKQNKTDTGPVEGETHKKFRVVGVGNVQVVERVGDDGVTHIKNQQVAFLEVIE